MGFKSELDQYASDVLSRVLQDTVIWIKKNKLPEDVFDNDQLCEWAIRNIFTEDE